MKAVIGFHDPPCFPRQHRVLSECMADSGSNRKRGRPPALILALPFLVDTISGSGSACIFSMLSRVLYERLGDSLVGNVLAV